MELSGEGFAYNPGDHQSHQIPNDLGLGQHSFYVAYYPNGSEQGAIKSPSTQFSVQAIDLPDPGLTFTIKPEQVPQGEMGEMDIQLACGTQCGSGGGNFFINDEFAGGYQIDENGEAVTYSLTTLTAGTYSLKVNWFGNGTVKQATLARTLTIVPNQLPDGVIMASIDPQKVPEGQWGWAHVHNICNSACGSGQYLIDGNFAGGFFLNDTGDDVVAIYPGLQPGDHHLTLTYFGNVNYKQFTSGDIPFTVVSNTLTPPVISAAPELAPVPAGQRSNLLISFKPPANGVSCEGQGQIKVDGQYSDAFFVQADNTIIGNNGPHPQLLSVPAGPHSVQVYYFGNSSCRYDAPSFPYTAQ